MWFTTSYWRKGLPSLILHATFCLLILAGAMPPAVAQRPTPDQGTTVTLHFPAHKTLGTLIDLTRSFADDDPSHLSGLDGFRWWHGFNFAGKNLGEAQGVVRRPRGTRLGLILDHAAMTGGVLEQLDPADFSAIYAKASKAELEAFKAVDPGIRLYLTVDETDTEAVDRLAAIRALKGLKVTDANTSSQLRMIARLAGLEELALERGQIDSRGLIFLAELPALRVLDVFRPIPGEGLRALAKFPALEELGLGRIDLRCLDFVERPPRLKALRLGGNGEFISPQQMANLARFKGIETLYCSHTINDGGLAELEKITTLKTLQIPATMGSYDLGITDAGLAHLGEIKALETVELGYGIFTGQGLASLANLPELKGLSLINAHNLVDTDLDCLKSCKNLEEFYTRGYAYNAKEQKMMPFGDHALQVIGAIPSLKRVSFHMRKGMSAEGLARLKRERPDLQLTFRFEWLKEQSRRRKKQ